MEESRPFQHEVLPERGRALVATRAIKPGEIVLREHCAAMVHTTANKVEDCHLMFARIQAAARNPTYRDAIHELVCMQERFDPEMLKNVSRSATAAVAKIISAWHGKDAAQQVSAEEIVQIFCKHALNSMTVVTPDLSSSEVGMALYPVHGALINHADKPNCWTLFEKEERQDEGQDAAAAATCGAVACPSYTLVVRCIAPISAGEEITICYLDAAQSRAELHDELERLYFIPKLPTPGPTNHSADAEALSRIAAAHGMLEGIAPSVSSVSSVSCPTDPGAMCALLCAALARAMDAADWERVLVCCTDLLYLWQRFQRYPIHPKVGLWMMTSGLAALKSGKDMSVAKTHLDRALRVLVLTHGNTHKVTENARQTAALVAQLMPRP